MNTSQRRQNFENIAWFLDLFKRKRLDMDPPFQRRSVWNQTYREDFIDTILMNYPAPAIFLFTNISESGTTTFQLVDGKQRLTSIFDFIEGKYPIGDRSPLESMRGTYFDSLPKDYKIAFFQYDFSVEYLPTNNEDIISNVFDRLNRNVVRLTPQELRHARFSGRFITQAEGLQEWMEGKLGKQFPRINESSRRQMKDVEVVATLLLYLEEGVKGYSAIKLDEAFSDRDEEWEHESRVVDEFRATVGVLSSWLERSEGQWLLQSRFRNQADFYSLFASIAELRREKAVDKNPAVNLERLESFLTLLESDDRLEKTKSALAYYDAARSASNDPGARRVRIDVMKRVLKGDSLADDTK